MIAARTAAQFIRENLVVETVAPGLRLYCAHAGSGLRRLRLGAAPYWAYPWAGGMALAAHIDAHQGDFAGRSVLDIGCGGGIAAIAAARAGAAPVTAVDIDPYAVAAAKLNAELNAVAITPIEADMLDGQPPVVDIVLAGDLFYDAQVAERALAFLTRRAEAGSRVLIGDPYRAHLPEAALRRIGEYAVGDVGSARSSRETKAGVFALDGQAPSSLSK